MALDGPFLDRLRQIAAALDDDALAAMANKGLVRRAQKDLETAAPQILEVLSDRVRIRVAEAAVEIPELPSKSTCSCPATGICRHILSALLLLRSLPAEVKPHTPPQVAPAVSGSAGVPPEITSAIKLLAAATDEQLQAWGGKPLFKKALKSISEGLRYEIETKRQLLIRFPTRNITCRWLPGGGLVSVLCSCQAEEVCEHVLAAVLALQIQHGQRQVVAEETLLEASAGAPRTREEVLASVGQVLREMIGVGLTGLSKATVDRLQTLAISAHGVDLPRLERMLVSLGDAVRLQLDRHAQASTTSVLAQGARIEALAAALHRPTPALIGRHRSRYDDVGQLQLMGLGAQRWRAPSGYAGLTLYFWDASLGSWSTWTDTRPVQQEDFNPLVRYTGPGPWTGCHSPRDAARKQVRLTNAYRSAAGRLSGRASTVALVGQGSDARSLPCLWTQWKEVGKRARELYGGGLAERDAPKEIVLLKPAQWGPPAFDPLSQRLVRPIVDDTGRVLPLVLPFTDENQTAVRTLEQHDPLATYGVLGLVRLLAGQLSIQPISLITEQEIICLNLDGDADAKTAKKSAARSNAAGQSEEADEEAYAEAEIATSATPLSQMLTTAQAELEAIAESGVSVRRKRELVAQLAGRFDALGLPTCSQPLSRLLELLTRAGTSAEPADQHAAAGQLLRAYYILRLAGDEEAVSLATAGVG